MKDNTSLGALNLLIEEKIRYFERILDISNKQTELINKEDFEKLQSLVNKKDEIINEISKLDEKLDPLIEGVLDKFKIDRSDWMNTLVKKKEVPEKTRENIKILVDILSKLQKIDNSNLSKMEEKRLDLNEGMKEVHKGRRVNKGYNNKNRIYSTFIDKRS